ncbi:hypothetical protein D621_10035 [beta proteobacterium AAP51]|nr:hypothetical protein D621_10035 [beta proteobacterium AAP51]
MKPVLILQHLNTDGPAYLQQWLQTEGLAHEVFNTEAGQAFPASLAPYGALAILGGEMSANDDLPSLRRAEALFLQAVASGVPTLGHCLGGQLMARALGAAVVASPAPEIGWQPMQVQAPPEAQAEALAWFGHEGEHHVYHWHAESFGLPAGAAWLARSAACPHQAFALGPHLGMQFHVEVDEAKLRYWAQENDEAWFDPITCPSVQRPGPMLADTPARLPVQQALARRIYARWMGLASGR